MSVSELERLEAESIHVMREVAAELERPVLLFSGGKDRSSCSSSRSRRSAPARSRSRSCMSTPATTSPR